MNKIRRVNLFGGPGVGKSTQAAQIYAGLSKHGVQTELVREVVKTWAYEGRRTVGFENFLTFGQQLYEEVVALRGGVEVIVTDSPLFLQAFYTSYYNLPCLEEMIGVCKEFEKQYPSWNFFIPRRTGRIYTSVGRNETQQEAYRLDDELMSFLDATVPQVKLLNSYETVTRDLFGENYV